MGILAIMLKEHVLLGFPTKFSNVRRHCNRMKLGMKERVLAICLII